jgi:hypothetical protein
MQHGTQLPPTGLPHRFTLLIIQATGAALAVAGFLALVKGEPPYLSQVFGLLLILNGVDVIRHPATRHRGMQELALKLLDRWRSPPVP